MSPYNSPFVGAEWILSAHNGAERIGDIISENWHPLGEINPILSRAMASFLAWCPFALLENEFQQSLFGNSGKDSSKTAFYYDSVNERASRTNSSGILANRVQMQWTGGKNINPTQVFLYLFSALDLTAHTHTNFRNGMANGDISRYVEILNIKNPKRKLSIESLRKQSLINFANPFIWFALWAEGSYIAKGNSSELPMISLGKDYHYLPSLQFSLSPFGPEWYTEHFIRKGENPIYFYTRYGRFDDSYYGIGLENSRVWKFPSGSLVDELGICIDLWRQHILLSMMETESSKEIITEGLSFGEASFGEAFSLILRKYSDSGNWYLQLGGKSNGFLKGYPLEAGLILRGGISVKW